MFLTALRPLLPTSCSSSPSPTTTPCLPREQVLPPSIFSRAFATHVDAPLVGEKFFNRRQEITALTRVLSAKPQVSIVTGPVDSGKTSLILKIPKDLSENNHRPVLHLDLRSRSFNSVSSFADTWTREFRSWLDRFAGVAKQFNLTTSGCGFNIDAQLKETRAEELPPVDRLNLLFDKMSEQLPRYDWWHGSQSPILFIDEANRLSTLLDEEEGHAALVDMFKWLVKSTKRYSQLHVILGSSDSFFHSWVEEYVKASRFERYVIGNLPEKEAERFWNEHILPDLKRRAPELSSPSFSDAYWACGGSMFQLDKYCNHYIFTEGKMTPQEFPMIAKERARLFSALHKGRNGVISPVAPTGPQPLWSRKQLISIIRKMIASEEGFLIYEDLCEEFGKDVVDSVIAHNLLHHRPSQKFSYDLSPYQEDQTVVTPESRSALRAMESLIKEVDKKTGGCTS